MPDDISLELQGRFRSARFYLSTVICSISKGMSIPKLIRENMRMYLPDLAPSAFRYIWKEIRLAREAMRVPKPPISAPRSILAPFSVKPDSITVAGTLLITCESRAVTMSSRPVSMEEKKSLTGKKQKESIIEEAHNNIKQQIDSR